MPPCVNCTDTSSSPPPRRTLAGPWHECCGLLFHDAKSGSANAQTKVRTYCGHPDGFGGSAVGRRDDYVASPHPCSPIIFLNIFTVRGPNPAGLFAATIARSNV